MKKTGTKEWLGFAAALLAVGTACADAGCQTKSAPAADSFITADPNLFAIHSINRYPDQSANATFDVIVVVVATFTNHERIAQAIAPSHFILTDQATNATYYALSGGSVNVIPMTQRVLDPGNSADITIGFRVPTATTSARLMYHP